MRMILYPHMTLGHELGTEARRIHARKKSTFGKRKISYWCYSAADVKEIRCSEQKQMSTKYLLFESININNVHNEVDLNRTKKKRKEVREELVEAVYCFKWRFHRQELH